MRDGIMVIDKPAGMTSHDVVIRARKRTGIRRIGHAGTLDPFAQGVLILLIGSATKLFSDFQNLEKEYIGTIEFGYTTDTYDGTGKKTHEHERPFSVDRSILEQILKDLIGDHKQTPPPFSAVKVQGRKSYEFARKGIALSLPAKNVTIYEADLLSLEKNEARVRFVVSSGTYVRSLAHLIGEQLGYGGVLISLVRTRIGPYTLGDAVSLSEISPEKISAYP